jgi:hypothetical protein
VAASDGRDPGDDTRRKASGCKATQRKRQPRVGEDRRVGADNGGGDTDVTVQSDSHHTSSTVVQRSRYCRP